MDLVFLVRSERERTRDLMRFIKALHSVFLGHIDSQESRKRESTLRSLTRSCHVTSCLILSTTTAIPLCTRCGSEFKAEPRDTTFLEFPLSQSLQNKNRYYINHQSHVSLWKIPNTKQKPVKETALGFLYIYIFFLNSCGSSKRNYY